MATLIFRGDAPAVAEIGTLTPGTVEIGDIFTVEINDKTLSFTATTVTVANVTDGLTTAWNASTIPEFAEITAVDGTTVVTLTHDVAGVPFMADLTASTTDGGGNDTQTLVAATTTIGTGPNFWVAANFLDPSDDSTALPGAGDDVYLSDSSVSILYGLDQSGAGLLGSLHIEAGYQGHIGLPKTNTGVENVTYDEYRERYLEIDVTTLAIGEGDGTGSGRIKLNLDAAVTATTVFTTGASVETDRHALEIKGGGAGSTLTAHGGSVDYARLGGDTAVLTTLTANGEAVVRCGSGVTLTTVNVEGTADVTIDSNTTTINTRDSATLNKRAGTVTTLNAFGSQTNLLGAGTITNLSLGAGRTLDAGRLAAGVTITNAGAIGKDASINDPAGKLTWSAGYVVDGAGLHEVNHVTKQGATVTVS